MEPGKAYLIHCGDWHTFVGRVAAQVGPYTYRLEKVSKVRNTNNGDVWEQLCAGDKRLRKAATYAHYKSAILPLTVAAFEWVGKVPQEEGLE